MKRFKMGFLIPSVALLFGVAVHAAGLYHLEMNSILLV
jgi:hypothetical protein